MIFLLSCLIASQQTFEITQNSVKSLVLYFGSRDSMEVEVNSAIQTYFSDMNKARGITLDIELGDGSTLGPFDHNSHLDGIDFHQMYSNETNYKLSFENENDYDIQLAMVFTENLESSLYLINHNYSNFYFPITNYQSKKYTYFYSGGLIYHTKKFSTAFFIGVPIALVVVIVVSIIFSIPNINKQIFKRKKSKVENENSGK